LSVSAAAIFLPSSVSLALSLSSNVNSFAGPQEDVTGPDGDILVRD